MLICILALLLLAMSLYGVAVVGLLPRIRSELTGPGKWWRALVLAMIAPHCLLCFYFVGLLCPGNRSMNAPLRRLDPWRLNLFIVRCQQRMHKAQDEARWARQEVERWEKRWDRELEDRKADAERRVSGILNNAWLRAADAARGAVQVALEREMRERGGTTSTPVIHNAIPVRRKA